jgi:hypothetical protein
MWTFFFSFLSAYIRCSGGLIVPIPNSITFHVGKLPPPSPPAHKPLQDKPHPFAFWLLSLR